LPVLRRIQGYLPASVRLKTLQRQMEEELLYWQRLAELRGELVGALMSRNNSMAATLINRIEAHQKTRPGTSEGTKAANLRRANIALALENIQQAVTDLEHYID
jgi:hypothetical protein